MSRTGGPLSSDNKEVAGCGRLRRPSSQPAGNGRSRGREVLEWKVAEPGSLVVLAGSATANVR